MGFEKFSKLFVSVFLFSLHPVLAQAINENEAEQKQIYNKGILLLKDGSAIQASYTKTPTGYFLRDKKIGKLIKNEQMLDVISSSYFQKIKRGDKLDSAWESLLYFDSSASWQWHSDLEKSNREDFLVRFTKIGLLLLSGFTYYEAYQANEAISGSLTGIDSGSARNNFKRKNSLFLAVGGITLAFYTFSTIKAYIRFDTNSDYNKLNIKNRKKESLPQYLNRTEKNAGFDNLEIKFITEFRF